MAQSNFIVAICGGSGSGKTTFAKAFCCYLGPEKCLMIGQDSYYKDQSNKFSQSQDLVNFDHPESIDFQLMATHLQLLKEGKAIYHPHYDFKTHCRLKENTYCESRPIIIIDGILLLAEKILLPFLDYSIFLDIDEKTRFERRLKRDMEERGRSLESIYEQFYGQVRPMHDLFVGPSKKNANIIFKNNKNAMDHIAELADMIDKIQSEHSTQVL